MAADPRYHLLHVNKGSLPLVSSILHNFYIFVLFYRKKSSWVFYQMLKLTIKNVCRHLKNYILAIVLVCLYLLDTVIHCLNSSKVARISCLSRKVYFVFTFCPDPETHQWINCTSRIRVQHSCLFYIILFQSGAMRLLASLSADSESSAPMGPIGLETAANMMISIALVWAEDPFFIL